MFFYVCTCYIINQAYKKFIYLSFYLQSSRHGRMLNRIILKVFILPVRIYDVTNIDVIYILVIGKCLFSSHMFYIMLKFITIKNVWNRCCIELQLDLVIFRNCAKTPFLKIATDFQSSVNHPL